MIVLLSFILLFSIKLFSMAPLADSENVTVTFRLNCVQASTAKKQAMHYGFKNIEDITVGPNNCLTLCGEQYEVDQLKKQLIAFDKSQR